jgi:hypothetical protein
MIRAASSPITSSISSSKSLERCHAAIGVSVHLVAPEGTLCRLRIQLHGVFAIQEFSHYFSLWRTTSVAASVAARRTNSDHETPKCRAARRTSKALSGSSLIEINAPSWGEAVSGSDSLAQPFSSHSFSLLIGVNGSETDLTARLAMVAPRSLLLILEAFPFDIGRQPSRNRSPYAGVLPSWFSKHCGDENSGWRSPD